MKVIAIISFILMAVYLLFCAIRYGVKGYVSDNYYIAKEKWLFSAMMMSTAVVLCPLMITKGGDTWGFLGALAGFGLLLVGVEPHYKDFGGLAHNIGAYMSALSSIVFSYVFKPFWLAQALLAMAVLVLIFGRTHLFYIGEVTLFTLIYLVLIFA